jgi:hypothetical protein
LSFPTPYLYAGSFGPTRQNHSVPVNAKVSTELPSKTE